MSEEPKGARKAALALIKDLDRANTDVEERLIACKEAEDKHVVAVRHRNDILFKLTDLISRCMDSFGSDEAK